MLHTMNPAFYMPENRLHEVGNCPCCGSATALGNGVIALAHYMSQGQHALGMIWFCSAECYLSFEHRDYMGKA